VKKVPQIVAKIKEKDIELMQITLADLKVKVEGTDHRH
jgi:hypothetical protein